MTNIPIKGKVMRKFYLVVIGTVFAVLISGCALFDPLRSVKAEAEVVCNYLNDIHSHKGKDDNVAEIKKVMFALARKKSSNELTRLFCQYEAGLVLPSTGKKIPKSEPIPKMFARLKEKGIINKVDSCKLKGLTKEECDCIEAGGSRFSCQKRNKDGHKSTRQSK